MERSAPNLKVLLNHTVLYVIHAFIMGTHNTEILSGMSLPKPNLTTLPPEFCSSKGKMEKIQFI